MLMAMKRAVLGGVIAALGVAGVVASRRASADAPAVAPTLHELLHVSGTDLDMPLVGGDAVGSGGAPGGRQPAAFAAGDKVLPKPAVDAPGAGARPDAEPVLGAGGFGADRTTKMGADPNTGTDPKLHYASVFNPDVLPFKRMSALDLATEDFVLVVATPAPVDVPVGGATDKSRDRFWGSMLVQLEPGVPVALPSVAPDMRILSYETKPAIALAFSKDGADNFFVRTAAKTAKGTYRLVFLADANAGYFAPALPIRARYTPRLVASATPPALLHPLPAAVKREAMITLHRIGIDSDMSLPVAFNKLVGYFREFHEGTLPPTSGNLYRDLCDSQLGVCRHRAFAFAITAIALGVPARYVQNEAHAFAEVWMPESGWMRIDLGGAALQMDVTGADGKTLHRPRSEDPFEKPKAYANNYTQLNGDVKGLTTQQLADKRKSLDDSPPSGSYDSVGLGGGTAGNGSGGAAGANGKLDFNRASGTTPPPDQIKPDPGLPTVTPDPKKRDVQLEVTLAAESAYRGDLVHVEGSALSGGKPLPDHVIDVFVAPAGGGGEHSVAIGRAVTGPDGVFRQDFSVPAGLALQTYEIYLSASGDPRFNGAVSH